MSQFQMMYATVTALLTDRVKALRGERGDGGGNALTTVLLTVGGVVAVGLVVAAIAAAVNGKLGNL